MIIAFIVLLSILILFSVISYFLLRKTFKVTLDGNEIVIKNSGSFVKIFSEKRLIKSIFRPNLIQGDQIDFEINDKKYVLQFKSNKFGNKVQFKIFFDGNLVADNGVVLK